MSGTRCPPQGLSGFPVLGGVFQFPEARSDRRLGEFKVSVTAEREGALADDSAGAREASDAGTEGDRGSTLQQKENNTLESKGGLQVGGVAEPPRIPRPTEFFALAESLLFEPEAALLSRGRPGPLVTGRLCMG